ncbi:protein kinase [Streptomyces sp. NPDC013489]|uniref:serine/threonine-protein kinase n=1 Tax=Streptomyces sp. NPDC013489 TaxID=3155606 RepID=UPI0033C92596
MTEQNPELIAGRYELVERIGQGGMGRVWRGLDQQLFGREVAVKEILFPPGMDDDDRAVLLRRFTGEARAAVTLSHPGVITVHDVVEHRGAPVIIMELIRGQSLAAAIRSHGRLPVRRVAEIGAAMLDALAEAHRARIVHRDIKPDNVLLTKDRVVLTDFGIAHLADATTKLSHSGIVIGTPQYMPPEQLDGKRPTPANDLWALGATCTTPSKDTRRSRPRGSTPSPSRCSPARTGRRSMPARWLPSSTRSSPRTRLSAWVPRKRRRCWRPCCAPRAVLTSPPSAGRSASVAPNPYRTLRRRTLPSRPRRGRHRPRRLRRHPRPPSWTPGPPAALRASPSPTARPTRPCPYPGARARSRSTRPSSRHAEAPRPPDGPDSPGAPRSSARRWRCWPRAPS